MYYYSLNSIFLKALFDNWTRGFMHFPIINALDWTLITDQIVENGIFIKDDFLHPDCIPTLDQWFTELEAKDLLKQAKIGNTLTLNENKLIRNDKIYWIENFPATLSEITSFLDLFKETMNKNLFLSLKRYEMHLSQYDTGSFYKKHLDQSTQNKNRILTVIIYLNKNWQSTDGGLLSVYSGTDSEKILFQVNPTFGKLVVFRSDLFPHEVMVANKKRRALTGWFRND